MCYIYLYLLHDFKNEIEMEKLKIEACIEQYRKIDIEIEEIFFLDMFRPRSGPRSRLSL